MRNYLLMLVAVAAAACTTVGLAQKKAVPFGVDKRPQPAGADLEFLVPKGVGTFTRDEFPKGAKPREDEDVNVEYRSGDDKVFFGFSIPATNKDAYEAVKVTRQEAIDTRLELRGSQYVVGKDPSYFKKSDFMSWTRGRYFFYAKASSPEALEKFMRAFPY